MYNNEDKEKKLSCGGPILILYVIGVIFFANNRLMPNFKKDGGRSRVKSCYSNVRVIQGAVEMYNMDSNVLMKDLDTDTLIKYNYLKEKPFLPENSCNYLGDNLDKDGTVYCDYHGDLEGKKYDRSLGTPEEQRIAVRNKFINELPERILPALIWPIFLLFILVVSLKK